MCKLLIGLLGLLVVAAIIPIAVIFFGAPTSPPPMHSMAPPVRQISQDLPEPRHFQARDGVSLQYYAYPAEPNKVAVLVHGSANLATSMHHLAKFLSTAGITVYVPDIRGHGGSGRRGDIDYVGQIDDDLADFETQLGSASTGETRTLVGFSAGAGFTIRFAGGPYGHLFDRYVFLAPILPGAPTLRPNAGGWTNIALPRTMMIFWLNRLGMHWFDGFPVIRYAISPDKPGSMTGSYSYRLMTNFGAGRQFATYLKNIRRPAAILVGDADEQVVADQFGPLLKSLGLTIPVTVLPNIKHADMIHKPEAFPAIRTAISEK